jgi:hypothetical protein
MKDIAVVSVPRKFTDAFTPVKIQVPDTVQPEIHVNVHVSPDRAAPEVPETTPTPSELLVTPLVVNPPKLPAKEAIVP